MPTPLVIATLSLLALLSWGWQTFWLQGAMRKREVNRKIGGGDPTAATASYHKSKIFLLLLILTASALVVSGRIQGESPIALIQIVPVLVAINIACLLVTLPGYFLARWAVRKVATKTN